MFFLTICHVKGKMLNFSSLYCIFLLSEKNIFCHLLYLIVEISVRLKSKREHMNTVNFYLRDILMLLVSVVFKHIDQIQELLICKC